MVILKSINVDLSGPVYVTYLVLQETQPPTLSNSVCAMPQNGACFLMKLSGLEGSDIDIFSVSSVFW